MKQYQIDRLRITLADNRKKMGEAAARDIAAEIRKILEEKEEVRMIFAAAPSQNDVLLALSGDKTVPWERIRGYHMDEYAGLPAGAPQLFSRYLDEHIFGLVPFRSIDRFDSRNEAEAECLRYGRIIRDNPPDLIVMGIGENGHIAFNDPGVADFHDRETVKKVALDPVCRMQQVHDGCFASLAEVPEYALTLTVPVFENCPALFCVVPAASKAAAVKATLFGEISEQCPASVLRRHPNAHLYLDPDSGSLPELKNV